MRNLFGLRALALFWAGLLMLTGAGLGTLQIMGPPRAPVVAVSKPQPTVGRPAAWEVPRSPAPVAPIAALAPLAPATSPAAKPDERAASAPAGAEDQHHPQTPPASTAPLATTPPASAPPPASEPPAAMAASPAPPQPPLRVAAPDVALMEPSVFFWPAQLPRVAADGRKARMVYAAPIPEAAPGMPRVALLLSGFGLTEKESRAAIDTLPSAVSFAVSAYAGAPLPLLEAARAARHELLASIPMEPPGFPLNDEGEKSLRAGLTAEQNRQYLEWALSRTQGVVGATAASDGLRGERFADVSSAFNPVLETVSRRGLLYIDPRPGRRSATPGLASRSVDSVIDESLARVEIEAKLVMLANLAKERGQALGLAGPLRPATIELIASWAKTLADRGVVLVPVSALVNE